MKCRACGTNWILGNQKPQINECPLCNRPFAQFLEDREYADIFELIQVLYLEKDSSFFEKADGLNAYLNDYFPNENYTRAKVKEQFHDALIKETFDWAHGHISYDKLQECIKPFVTENNQELINFIYYICGYPPNVGSTFDDKFYLECYSQIKDGKLKLIALEKAAQRNNSKSHQIKLAELKKELGDDSWRDTIEKVYDSDDPKILLSVYRILKGVKDFDRAMSCLIKAESLGDVDAQYYLGKEYIAGIRIKKNLTKGYDLLEKSANNGRPEACYILYNYYLNKGDTQKSRKYLEKAVKSGDVQSCYEYALHLLEGDLVTENVDKSVHILESCANRGHKESIIKLIYLYSVGYKVKKEKDKTILWKEKLNGLT